MTLAPPPTVRRRFTPRPRAWLLAIVGVLVAMAVVGIWTAVSHKEPSSGVTRGSGVSATEPRNVSTFTDVELAGSNTVTIRVGAPPSVEVTGDDNLVGRVTTVVRTGRLVIGNTGAFTTKAPMHIAVSLSSLDSVELSGTGTVTVEGVASPQFAARLSGTGTLVASGTTQKLTAVLGDTGTLDLHDLVAVDVTAQLEGTGTIRIHATSTLDATLTGSGSILYQGNPMVTTRKTGTGTIAAS